MSDVSRGPVSTLPGHKGHPPHGTICDEHPEELAVMRVQGETDSFGCEYYDLCQDCLDERKEQLTEPVVAMCEWCNTEANDIRPHRDYEEGMFGPVYQVCGNCVRKERERMREEYDG